MIDAERHSSGTDDQVRLHSAPHVQQCVPMLKHRVQKLFCARQLLWRSPNGCPWRKASRVIGT